ncbi:MAG: hydrogenase maturation nickel metallochaperone HypA [Bacillota bacterium]|nr:hydrogenase maturation nickel metallochaperone HypA [Bacillota bacterium]
MHELSIVENIVETLEEFSKENSLSKIGSVTVVMGEVSGVVPHYLTDAWDWFTKKSELMKGSKLIIESKPAVTICNSCHKTYPTLKYAKICPYCQSEDTVLQEGDELYIKEIEAE